MTEKEREEEKFEVDDSEHDGVIRIYPDNDIKEVYIKVEVL